MQRNFFSGSFQSRLEDSLLRGCKLHKAGVPEDDIVDFSDSDGEATPTSTSSGCGFGSTNSLLRERNPSALGSRQGSKRFKSSPSSVGSGTSRRSAKTAVVVPRHKVVPLVILRKGQTVDDLSPVGRALFAAQEWDSSDPNFVLGASVAVPMTAHPRHVHGSRCPELYSAFFEYGGVRRHVSGSHLHLSRVAFFNTDMGLSGDWQAVSSQVFSYHHRSAGREKEGQA